MLYFNSTNGYNKKGGEPLSIAFPEFILRFQAGNACISGP